MWHNLIFQFLFASVFFTFELILYPRYVCAAGVKGRSGDTITSSLNTKDWSLIHLFTHPPKYIEIFFNAFGKYWHMQLINH